MNEPISTELPSPDHRSGYVAVIGRPNVGKSTLFNRLLGQKIAITSHKPQTTRDRLLGIYTQEDAQIIFFDTPGIHHPKHKLGQHLVSVAEEAVQDADVILWLVDTSVIPTHDDYLIAERLHILHKKKPIKSVVIGLNKADHPKAREVTLQRSREYQALLTDVLKGCEVQVALFSGREGHGVDRLVAMLRDLLPVGPRYYAEDEVTDLQMRFIAAELIREKALLLLSDEVPHSLAVEVDEFIQRTEKLTYISAILYVERDTQKAIILGEDGQMIKRIGTRARPEIEELVGTAVYLELWVKVWERWRDREGSLRRLGYAFSA